VTGLQELINPATENLQPDNLKFYHSLINGLSKETKEQSASSLSTRDGALVSNIKKLLPFVEKSMG